MAEAQWGSSASSRTFHPFKRLPTELRLNIWGISIPAGHERRVIDVIQKRVGGRGAAKIGDYYTTAACPALLHTCKESRGRALKTYKVLQIEDDEISYASYLFTGLPRFLRPTIIPNVPSKVCFSTYIDYSRDVIYLDPYAMATDTTNNHSSPANISILRFLEGLKLNLEASRAIESIGFSVTKNMTLLTMAHESMLDYVYHIAIHTELLEFENLKLICLADEIYDGALPYVLHRHRIHKRITHAQIEQPLVLGGDSIGFQYTMFQAAKTVYIGTGKKWYSGKKLTQLGHFPQVVEMKIQRG